MPELPEVETTLRGVAPHIVGKTTAGVEVRESRLRLPVPQNLQDLLAGQAVVSCGRRAKYLIIRFPAGIVLIHLGMSGSLRIFLPDAVPPAAKHDHIDFVFSDGTVMRYHDPRRFGMVVWFAGAAEHHPLLAGLGPEPLSEAFDCTYLKTAFSGQKRAVKTALMDNAVVVGVGNIYANESLFHAGILPMRAAGSLTDEECGMLVCQIKAVLAKAIEKGGSTLRDFVGSDGKSGYFQQEYAVYGREGEACRRCGTPVSRTVIGQRSTFYCGCCQQ